LSGQKRNVRPGSISSKATGRSWPGKAAIKAVAQGISRTGPEGPASRIASARATVRTDVEDPTTATGGGRVAKDRATSSPVSPTPRTPRHPNRTRRPCRGVATTTDSPSSSTALASFRPTQTSTAWRKCDQSRRSGKKTATSLETAAAPDPPSFDRHPSNASV